MIDFASIPARKKENKQKRISQRDMNARAVRLNLTEFYNPSDKSLTFFTSAAEAFFTANIETGTMTFKKKALFEGFATASLDDVSSFDVDFSDGDPDVLVVRILDCQVETDNVGFDILVSDDGGATYKSSSYRHGRDYFTPDGDFQSGSSSDSAITIAGNIGNASDERFNADVWLYRPFDTGYHKIIRATTNHLANDGQLVSGDAAGMWDGGTTAINSLRFQADSGSIVSAKVRAWVMSSI